MSHTTSPTLTQPSASATTYVAGRVAGGLALVHVVLMLGAFALEGLAPEHGTAPAKLFDSFAAAPLTRTLLAGYAESLSFFVLVPAVVVLGWLFSRRTTEGRLAAQTFVALGVSYVAGTLAVGMSPEAAGIYAAHHGVDPVSLAMVNDIRNYAYVLQVALTTAMALALGLAARFEGRHTRWVGWGGIGFGVVGLLVTPFAHNAVSMAFLVWWIGVAVVLLRDKPTRV